MPVDSTRRRNAARLSVNHILGRAPEGGGRSAPPRAPCGPRSRHPSGAVPAGGRGALAGVRPATRHGVLQLPARETFRAVQVQSVQIIFF